MDHHERQAGHSRGSVSVAFGIGVLAGTLVLAAHEMAPLPWSHVGESYALWAAIPLLAASQASTTLRALGLAWLSSLGLVGGYYGSLVVFLGRGDYTSRMIFWAVLALGLGCFVAPGVVRCRDDRIRGAVSGVVGAVFPGELLLDLGGFSLDDSSGRLFAGAWAVLGLALALTVPRTRWGLITAVVGLLGALPLIGPGHSLVLRIFDLVTT